MNDALELVRSLVERGVVPGAALCVTDEAGLVLEGYAGRTEQGGDEAVGEETRFALASLTKPLVALAVLVAVEEGVLDLDAPLAEVLPAAHPSLTVRACLAHYSGLPESAPLAPLGVGDTPAWAAYAEACLGVELEGEPGSRRIYSNVGYALAGLALERAAGLPVDRYLSEAVLGPLGLDRTSLGLPADAPAATVREPGLWTRGIHLFNSPWFRSQPLPQSAGFATARDYAAFLRCVLRGGTTDGGEAIVAPETCAELVTNQGGALAGGVLSFMTWPVADWGCGFEIRNGKERHWTGGSLSPRAASHFGASGTLCFLDPDAGLAAVLLTNRGTYAGWMLEPGGWPDIVAAIVR